MHKNDTHNKALTIRRILDKIPLIRGVIIPYNQRVNIQTNQAEIKYL